MEVLRWNSRSGCGTVVRKLPLKVREWTCQWGAVHDRDHNAAKDILAAGQGDRLNDCGVPCQNPFRRGLRSSNPPLCHTTPHGMGSEEEPGRIER
jgi:hypothetical protein